MDIAKALIKNWEQKVRDNDNTNLSDAYFSFDAETNKRIAVSLFRHVFENVLGWTPEDVRNNLSYEIIRSMKLVKPYRCVAKSFPKGIEERTGTWYLAKICYPDAIKDCEVEDIWKMQYMRVRNAKKGRYLTDFFTDAEGRLKARVCMQYELVNHVRFASQEEMYDFFADTEKSMELIKEAKLKTPMEIHYANPLEYMHDSLAPEDRSEFLLMFKRFEQLDEEYKRMHAADKKRKYRKKEKLQEE